MNDDDTIRWVYNAALDTSSIVFWWRGSFGIQPVLMPALPYYWWRDDTAPELQQTAEDDRRLGGGTH